MPSPSGQDGVDNIGTNPTDLPFAHSSQRPKAASDCGGRCVPDDFTLQGCKMNPTNDGPNQAGPPAKHDKIYVRVFCFNLIALSLVFVDVFLMSSKVNKIPSVAGYMFCFCSPFLD